MVIIFGIATLLGCSKGPSDINIRLLNSSQLKFENITVDTSNEPTNFGDLDSGQFSEFKTFEIAYSYAYVELEIDGANRRIVPADYLGESILENGDYTYKLDIDTTDSISLTIELIVE